MRKVTVVTACYNGERFIDAYARTLLSQTYHDVEILFVDDGSTDASAKKIKAYAQAFHEKGMDFQYFYQKNQGQAVATNTAFQHMTGEYFMLHDIDDLLEPECFEKRTAFLDKHPECGSVYSRVWTMAEGSDTKMEYRKIESFTVENIFDFVFNKFLSVLPILYMFRTTVFESCIPDKRIYESRATQDVQVVLPIIYVAKTGFIDDFLGTYLTHVDSHSQFIGGYEEKKRRWNQLSDVWLQTIEHISQMPDDEKEQYKNRIVMRNEWLQIREWILWQWNQLDAVQVDEPVVVFGCGVVGKELVSLLRNKGIKIAMIIDNNCANLGKTIDGIEVHAVQEIRMLDDPVVLIALRYKDETYDKMEDQLLKLQILDISYYLQFLLKAMYSEYRKNGIVSKQKECKDVMSRLLQNCNEDMSKRLSIIVPVYNSEKTLSRCINSILKQTYKNIEIILVDDGSNDGSMEKCEKYASDYCNIEVTYQAHSGPRLARKNGIKKAKGELIGFVDSDDWIEPNMYENMINAMADADICIGGHRIECKNEYEDYEIEAIEEGAFSNVEALTMMCEEQEFHWSMWDKIYKRNLFNESTFSKGQYYGEDFYANWQLFLAAKRIRTAPVYGYHHCFDNKNSLSNQDDFNELELIDVMINIREECEKQELIPIIQSVLEKKFSLYSCKLKEKNTEKRKAFVKKYKQLIFGRQ